MSSLYLCYTYMSDKPIAEKSNEELLESIQKHEFYIKLLKNELDKRGVKRPSKKTSSSTSTSTSKVGSTSTTSKAASATKIISKDIDATMAEMQLILAKNGIEFKKSSNRSELVSLIRKNGLVRKAESVS